MLTLPLCLVVQATAAERVAVFPFELLDRSQDDDLYPKVRPDETARLATLTKDLKDRLTASGKYEIVGLENLSGDIEKASPLFKCNGCDAGLAQKSGADIVMLGLVQKFSDTLLSVSIEVIDGKSGKVTATYSAGIQGNTEESWLRAERYIVKNKLFAVAEGTPQ